MYIEIEGAELKDFSNKKIILFGASSTGVKALEEFERIDAEILGFCDNGESKWGEELEGYKIYSPDEIKILLRKEEQIYIMITSTYEEEIKQQLKEMQISNVYAVHMGVLHSKLDYKFYDNKILSEKDANLKISELIESKKPFFVGRVGSTELETICNYKYFIDRKKHKEIPYTNNITNMLADWCGFFPRNHELMDDFCELYLSEIPKADML